MEPLSSSHPRRRRGLPNNGHGQKNGGPWQCLIAIVLVAGGGNGQLDGNKIRRRKQEETRDLDDWIWIKSQALTDG